MSIESLQLEEDFTAEQYQPVQGVTVSTSAPTGSAITSLSGLSGPTINITGGTTGYSFSPSAPDLVMTGGAKSITESSGPTTLNVGAIADGEFLKRSGGSIVSAAASGATLSVVTKSSNYTLTDADDVVECDTTGGGFTVTLHSAATAKKKPYYLIKTIAANTLTISAPGAETISGSASLTPTAQWTVYTLIPTGTDWRIV